MSSAAMARDRSRPRVVEADAAAESVHQPRLPPGLAPDCLQGLRRERLVGLPGVLVQQRAHLGLVEVAET